MIKVAVIDDRPLTLQAIQNAIDWEKRGIEPIGFFGDCEKALEMIRLNPPDVVVTDIVMPGISGLELCQCINNIFPNIKIIVMSAYSEFQYAQSAIRLGVVEYFEKPLDYEKLAECILRVGEQKQDQDRILAQVNSNAEAYRERFFMRLLRGEIDSCSINEEARKIGFLSDFSYSVCVSMTASSDIMDEASDTFCTKLTEIIKNMTVVGPFSLNTNQQCYILFWNNPNIEPKTIVRALRKITANSGTSDFSVWFGIGNIAMSLAEVSHSYNTSIIAIEFAEWLAEDKVFLYTDLTNSAVALQRCYHYEKKLEKLILQGNTPTFYDCISEFQQYCREGYPPKKYVISVLEKTMLELNTHYPELAYQRLELPLNKNLRICFQVFQSYCRSVFDITGKALLAFGGDIVEKIKDVINANYHDSNLNVISISKQVNMSPNYIGTLFKRKENMSITDYISAIRINQAKVLLTHSSKSILEISEETGYSSQYYFSSCFKKITGYSPGTFRKRFVKKTV